MSTVTYSNNIRIIPTSIYISLPIRTLHMNTINQKYLHMANEIKTNTKLGFENSYIDLIDGNVSTEPFQGYTNIIQSQKIADLAIMNEMSFDQDEFIDMIILEVLSQ